MSYLLFIPVIRTVLLWRSQEHLGRFLFVQPGIQADDHNHKHNFLWGHFAKFRLIWMSSSMCGRDIQSSNLHWRAGEQGGYPLKHADYEERILVKWSRFVWSGFEKQIYLCLSWVGNCCLFSSQRHWPNRLKTAVALFKTTPGPGVCSVQEGWMDVLLNFSEGEQCNW